MAGRVKADCGANSMEHSYALTQLIPIGLRAIGCHLDSGVNGFPYSVLYAPPKFRANVLQWILMPTIIDRLGDPQSH